jgi:hypothetical protein
MVTWDDILSNWSTIYSGIIYDETIGSIGSRIKGVMQTSCAKKKQNLVRFRFNGSISQRGYNISAASYNSDSTSFATYLIYLAVIKF